MKTEELRSVFQIGQKILLIEAQGAFLKDLDLTDFKVVQVEVTGLEAA